MEARRADDPALRWPSDAGGCRRDRDQPPIGGTVHPVAAGIRDGQFKDVEEVGHPRARSLPTRPLTRTQAIHVEGLRRRDRRRLLLRRWAGHSRLTPRSLQSFPRRPTYLPALSRPPQATAPSITRVETSASRPAVAAAPASLNPVPPRPAAAPTIIQADPDGQAVAEVPATLDRQPAPSSIAAAGRSEAD